MLISYRGFSEVPHYQIKNLKYEEKGIAQSLITINMNLIKVWHLLI